VDSVYVVASAFFQVIAALKKKFGKKIWEKNLGKNILRALLKQQNRYLEKYYSICLNINARIVYVHM
jgi:hypothetical protein